MGADTRLRSSDEGEEAEHRWGPLPLRQELAGLCCREWTGASSSRGSPEPHLWVCGRLRTPVEASLTCLACGLCWSRHRRCSPCSAPWGPPRHLGFGLCVYIFGASGASLPRACVAGPSLTPPHGDPSRGRPRGSQQGPLPQSGCQSLDVSRAPSVGVCHSKFTLFFFHSPFS